MARQARSSMICPDTITIAHVWTQVTQQMFLLGDDPLTSKDFSHRKDWFIEIMAHQSMFMAVDILRFAIMDNHTHFLLRTRPDIVRGWSDQEVAWNYLLLCPRNKRRRKVQGKWVYEVVEPNQEDIDAIVGDPKKLKKIRQKLSSISFWMQLLKQKVAKRANAEVQKGGVCKGAFWKGRFEMTIINTREYLLTCAAYIDLNAFKAGMTESLEGYPYTSIYLQLKEMLNKMLMEGALKATERNPLGEFPESAMLSPVEFREETQEDAGDRDEKGGAMSLRKRCSDTGFLEISSEQYCELLRWSMAQLRSEGDGKIRGLEHAVVSSHGMTSEVWRDRLRNFRKMYRYEAGVSKRKIMEGFCGEPTAAMFLALRDFRSEGSTGSV